MEFFNKVIRPGEIETLLSLDREEGSVHIGRLVDIQPEVLKAFTNIWCARLDKLIQMDLDVNGIPTQITANIKAVRAFTFDEYSALFNQHIPPEDFPFYPIFNQINRLKGGINTEKQRLDVTMRYEFSDEDYLRVLRDQGYIQILDVFVQDAIKPMATIPLEKLFMHMYCVAPTGEGKSVLLESLIHSLQSQYSQISLVVIDPHGSLAENVKRFKLNSDRERVIYIDPFFKDGYTPTFNPFAVTDQSLMNLNFVAEQFIKTLDEILDREGGELSENMVNMMEKCVYFLLKRKNSTFKDLLSLLSGEVEIFREARQFDPIFDDYFLKPGNKTREALHNRISRLLNSPALFNLLGGQSTFDLEAAMNSGKVVIFDLSRLGEMSQITFGKLLVTSIKSIVRKRKKNCDTHTICIIDEAQNFATGSLEYILAQLRGFGLHMVLANQYPEQFESQLKAVIENTAIKIAGGGDDNIESIRDVVKLKYDISLREYEFFLKVRHKGVVKFKSPSFLIEQPQLYYMSNEEEKAFDEFQIQNYYKPLEEQVSNVVEIPAIIPTDDLKKIIPPFTLTIPEE